MVDALLQKEIPTKPEEVAAQGPAFSTTAGDLNLDFSTNQEGLKLKRQALKKLRLFIAEASEPFSIPLATTLSPLVEPVTTREDEEKIYSISPSNSFNNTISFPLSPSISQPRLLRFSSKANHSSNNSGDDSFEFFPWSDSDSEIQWLLEDRVTLFTTDGLFQIGGKMVPRRVRSSDMILSSNFIYFAFCLTKQLKP
uniref:Uncharacterized protein LOC113786666 n=1 Tax=Cicer arietinum TaxID=3827 RepID=A0A3Q7YBE3_CICAR|nr:uncharacterized protein LOC113786666 [Cicer arietinum]